MRTASAGMIATLARSGKRLAKMVRLERIDGTVLCMTDHDQELIFDVAGDGDETYLPLGIQISDIGASAGLEADNAEISGPLSDNGVTLAGVLGQRYNGARAWVFEVDWSDLSAGDLPLMGGQVFEARIQGSGFVIEIQNDFARLKQEVGSQIVNSCRWTHGDENCARVPEADVATVVSASDGMALMVTTVDAHIDHYFDKGWLIGLTGENVGVKLEIEKYLATGAITMWGFFPVVPQAGDTFDIVRGCGKTRADCMARNNMVRFGGHPDVPGAQIMRPAIPGANNG